MQIVNYQNKLNVDTTPFYSAFIDADYEIFNKIIDQRPDIIDWPKNIITTAGILTLRAESNLNYFHLWEIQNVFNEKFGNSSLSENQDYRGDALQFYTQYFSHEEVISWGSEDLFHVFFNSIPKGFSQEVLKGMLSSSSKLNTHTLLSDFMQVFHKQLEFEEDLYINTQQSKSITKETALAVYRTLFSCPEAARFAGGDLSFYFEIALLYGYGQEIADAMLSPSSSFKINQEFLEDLIQVLHEYFHRDKTQKDLALSIYSIIFSHSSFEYLDYESLSYRIGDAFKEGYGEEVLQALFSPDSKVGILKAELNEIAEMCRDYYK